MRQRAFTRKIYVAPATRCHLETKMTVEELARADASTLITYSISFITMMELKKNNKNEKGRIYHKTTYVYVHVIMVNPKFYV